MGGFEFSFILKGRGALAGVAEGRAVVCPDSIAGNSGALGDSDGIIYERGNVNYGVCIKNAILVVPCAKGSCGFSSHFKSAFVSGVRPAGWVATRMDARLGVAVASMNIPTVCDFPDEQNPILCIKTGDWVKIDGSTGEVHVTREGLEAK